jgi:hypothetical protein
MSTRADFLHQTLSDRPTRIFGFEVAEEATRDSEQSKCWSERYSQQQIRGLVRQVFFPGWPKPARQVVFSAVQGGDAGDLCMQVGETLAAQIPGSVCVVDAAMQAGGADSAGADIAAPAGFGEAHSFRDWSKQISRKLWCAPLKIFAGGNGNGWPPDMLSMALRELRLEFDYTVLQGPPAGMSNEAALLGHLSDGVILVLEANATRKLAAQRAKQMFQEANVRLLGAVLNRRRFPIPEGIYRRL